MYVETESEDFQWYVHRDERIKHAGFHYRPAFIDTGKIALNPIFHFPRPEYIDLIGGGTGAGISHTELPYLKEHSAPVSEILNRMKA